MTSPLRDVSEPIPQPSGIQSDPANTCPSEKNRYPSSASANAGKRKPPPVDTLNAHFDSNCCSRAFRYGCLTSEPLPSAFRIASTTDDSYDVYSSSSASATRPCVTDVPIACRSFL